MRLRNIPRAEGVLKECSQVIETPEEFRDHWASDVFQNDYPVHKRPSPCCGKVKLIYRRKRKHSAKHSLHLYGRTGHSKCVR